MDGEDTQEVFELSKDQRSFFKRIIPIAAFIGGLCCFAPVVMVLLGLGSVAFAASLTQVLHGQYQWAFIGLAFAFLFAALFWYFYKKEKICTLDEVKRRKQLIINLSITAVIITAFAYLIWLYVIVEIMGIILGIW